MKTLELKKVLLCIHKMDMADYRTWEGRYNSAEKLMNSAKKILGDSFEDVKKARIGNPHYTKETTYKEICDRLREMGYILTKEEEE